MGRRKIFTDEENAERKKERAYEYYLKNREKILERNKARIRENRAKNPDAVRKYYREYNRRRAMLEVYQNSDSSTPKKKDEQKLPLKFYEVFYKTAVENLQISTIKKLERIAKKEIGLPFEPANVVLIFPEKTENL